MHSILVLISYSNIEQFDRNWSITKSWIHRLTKKMNGYKLIYWKDEKFQLESELCHQGNLSLDQIIQRISKKNLPTQLQEMRSRKEEHSVKYGWYISNLNE